MSAYYDALDALGMRLLRLLGKTLNLPEGFFTDRFGEKYLGTLRPIHYSGRVSKPHDVRYQRPFLLSPRLFHHEYATQNC